jgi:hypothetical protein
MTATDKGFIYSGVFMILGALYLRNQYGRTEGK